MDDFVSHLPDRLQEAHCCKCGKVSGIVWMVETEQERKAGLPYCVDCKTLNWQAMAHLNRRLMGYYCQNRKDL